MQAECQAIVCGVRGHGEHWTVVRVLTAGDGLVVAYVRGGRGRRLRPVLIPGNVVAAELRSRTEAQLPHATLELTHSRAPILAEALPAAAVEWTTALVAATLPERQPYPRLYLGLVGLLDAIEAAQSASGWGAALARFELLLLAELGYGRDTDDLPEWIRTGSPLKWPQILAALDLSSRYLSAELLTGRAAALQDSRSRLAERLRRAAA